MFGAKLRIIPYSRNSRDNLTQLIVAMTSKEFDLLNIMDV